MKFPNNFTILNSHDVNCGSFALDYVDDWYQLYTFGDCVEELLLDEEIDNYIEEMAKEIENDFPELDRLPVLWSDKDYEGDQIIGFRVSIIEGDEAGYSWMNDFHFILRHAGEWYHKPGACPVEKLTEDPRMLIRDEFVWSPMRFDPYNSRIVWFRKAANKINYAEFEEDILNGLA